jgi:hypothetical protein
MKKFRIAFAGFIAGSMGMAPPSAVCVGVHAVFGFSFFGGSSEVFQESLDEHVSLFLMIWHIDRFAAVIDTSLASQLFVRAHAFQCRCEGTSPGIGLLRVAEDRGREEDPELPLLEKGDLLAFAGLYEFWPDPSLPEGEPHRWLLSWPFSPPRPRIPWARPREGPVIVPPDMSADWLNPGTTDKEDVQELLNAIPEPVLTPRVVTDRVNTTRNNGPELVEPAP